MTIRKKQPSRKTVTCGCSAMQERVLDASLQFWTWCPTHEVAFEMRDLLSNMAAYTSKPPETTGEFLVWGKLLGQAEELVKKCHYPEEGDQ